MNYNNYDYSDASLGFSDIAVVPQMTVDDDAISNMMFPSNAGRSSLDLFQLGDFDAPADRYEPLSMPDLVDIDFSVPELPQDCAVARYNANVPELGEMIPNSLPQLIESEDEDAAVPNFPVRGKGTMKGKSALGMHSTAMKRSRGAAHGYGKSAFAYADDWESDDAASDDEYVAPRRGRRVSRRPVSKSAVCPEEQDNLTREERVARWLEKKKRRVFKKTVRYESRKQYADKRPRIKGRFVAPEIYAEYMANQASQVVPSN
jgi:hypothetical protein